MKKVLFLIMLSCVLVGCTHTVNVDKQEETQQTKQTFMETNKKAKKLEKLIQKYAKGQEEYYNNVRRFTYYYTPLGRIEISEQNLSMEIEDVHSKEPLVQKVIKQIGPELENFIKEFEKNPTMLYPEKVIDGYGISLAEDVWYEEEKEKKIVKANIVMPMLQLVDSELKLKMDTYLQSTFILQELYQKDDILWIDFRTPLYNTDPFFKQHTSKYEWMGDTKGNCKTLKLVINQFEAQKLNEVQLEPLEQILKEKDASGEFYEKVKKDLEQVFYQKTLHKKGKYGQASTYTIENYSDKQASKGAFIELTVYF